MSAAKITVLVGKDTLLGRRTYLSGSGEPRGCLVIGGGGELASFGSPVALRRLAIAVRDAAKSAEKRRARGGVAGEGPRAA